MAHKQGIRGGSNGILSQAGEDRRVNKPKGLQIQGAWKGAIGTRRANDVKD